MSSKGKAVRLDPELWEECKAEAIEKLGKFSARAMQQAVLLYKKRDGRYGGVKSSTNSLVSWQKAQDASTKKPRREAGF